MPVPAFVGQSVEAAQRADADHGRSGHAGAGRPPPDAHVRRSRRARSAATARHRRPERRAVLGARRRSRDRRRAASDLQLLAGAAADHLAAEGADQRRSRGHAAGAARSGGHARRARRVDRSALHHRVQPPERAADRALHAAMRGPVEFVAVGDGQQCEFARPDLCVSRQQAGSRRAARSRSSTAATCAGSNCLSCSRRSRARRRSKRRASVASWFGSLAGYRGAVFPAQIDNAPLVGQRRRLRDLRCASGRRQHPGDLGPDDRRRRSRGACARAVPARARPQRRRTENRRASARHGPEHPVGQ